VVQAIPVGRSSVPILSDIAIGIMCVLRMPLLCCIPTFEAGVRQSSGAVETKGGRICDVAAELDVVTGKFSNLYMSFGAGNSLRSTETHLNLVHTNPLSNRSASELQSRDHVHGFCNNGSHDEGVGGGSKNICELDVELLPVMVDPTSWNVGIYIVHGNDARGRKECVEH